MGCVLHVMRQAYGLGYPQLMDEMTVSQRDDESTQDDGGNKRGQLQLQARRTGIADGRSGLMDR